MNDQVWPPPPEGRESTQVLKRLDGIDIWQGDQTLTLDFVSYRRSRFGFIIFFVVLGLAFWIGTAHAIGVAGLKFIWAKHPYHYFSSFVYAGIFWLEYLTSSCRGRYTLTRNGMLTGASLPSKHWKPIRHVRIAEWWTGKQIICLGLPKNEAATSWVFRNFICKKNEIPLPMIGNRYTGIALAKLISNFLSVDQPLLPGEHKAN